MHYRGWLIYPSGPSQYTAIRHGVTLSARSIRELQAMIDARKTNGDPFTYRSTPR